MHMYNSLLRVTTTRCYMLRCSMSQHHKSQGTQVYTSTPKQLLHKVKSSTISAGGSTGLHSVTPCIREIDSPSVTPRLRNMDSSSQQITEPRHTTAENLVQTSPVVIDNFLVKKRKWKIPLEVKSSRSSLAKVWLHIFTQSCINFWAVVFLNFSVDGQIKNYF